VNDSPRAREPLDKIRRRDALYRHAARLASLPVPAVLVLVVAHLAFGSWGRGAESGMASMTWGTLSIALAATALAAPLALGAALAMRQSLAPRSRRWLDGVLSGLSALPMVVLGFLFASQVGPALALAWGTPSLGPVLTGIAVATGMLPVLWKPFQEALDEIPAELTQGAIALGARPGRVLLGFEIAAAYPALVRALATAFARACGESVVVLMVSGNFASGWGGQAGAASLGAALLVLAPEAAPGSAEWVDVHRIALVLLALCVGVHALGRALEEKLR
jgi:ABC-type phosphate transport system permease subunit